MTKYVGALDQGTTSTRFMIFDHAGAVVAIDQKEHEQIYPKPGWVEHDAIEIWTRCQEVIAGALAKAGITAADLAAVGITNQRETTLVWDRKTGQPVYNAIVWQDTRTGPPRQRVRQGRRPGPLPGQGRPAAGDLLLRPQGPLDPGQRPRRPRDGRGRRPGVRQHGHLVHLEPHRRRQRRRARHRRHQRQPHHADEPRDPATGTTRSCGIMGVPKSMLPEIKASSEVYGTCVGASAPACRSPATWATSRRPSSARPASAPGEAKNTYGTGCFMLLNTGEKVVPSKNGLLTTVGYKIGDQPAVYALEGSIADHRRAGAVAARQPRHDREVPGGRGARRDGRGQRRRATSCRRSPACSRRTGRTTPAASSSA